MELYFPADMGWLQPFYRYILKVAREAYNVKTSVLHWHDKFNSDGDFYIWEVEWKIIASSHLFF